jgi:hypothetical protein
MKYRVNSNSMMLLLPLLAAACSGDGGDGGTPAVAAQQLDTAVAAQGVAQPAASVQSSSAFDIWAKRIMADRISPAVAAAGDLSQSWTAADGRTANVVVRAPRTVGKPTITIAAPAAGADATPLLQAGLAQLKRSGGGILKVAPGDYHFKTGNTEQAGVAQVLLSKLSDVDIQANNANFIFESNLDGIYIQDSQRIRVQGAKIRDGRVLSGTGRMRLVNGVLRLVLDQPLPAGVKINWVQPMNEGSIRSWPQIQSRAIIAPTTAQPTRLDDRTFTSSEFGTLKDGQYVAVKFTYYGNRAIYIRDSYAGMNEDILLDGIHIGSIGGIGVLVKTRGRGIAIQNSSISADAGRPYSTNFDGFHVMAAGGDILIRGNSFAHTGDDQINLRSIIHKVAPVSADSATLSNDGRLIRVGDELAFFDKAGEYLGRRVVNFAPPIGNSDTVTFRFAPGDPFTGAVYARDINITPRRFAIVNNTMAHSAGRGMLIQIPVGLIQGNTIRNLPRTAIRMLTSFDPWLEGAGAINVRITGNTIDSGGGEIGFNFVTGIITALGEVVSAKIPTNVLNGPIKIDNNKFTSPRAPCIAIYNTQGLVQENNKCGTS